LSFDCNVFAEKNQRWKCKTVHIFFCNSLIAFGFISS